MLILGNLLESVHIHLDLVFYSLLLALLSWFLGRPLLQYLSYPSVALVESFGRKEPPAVEKLYQKVLREGAIVGDQGASKEEVIRAFYEERFLEIETLIKERGKATFTYVALSQNGVLDTLLILGFNLDLLAKIFSKCKLRQSPRQLLSFYRNVLTGAAVTGLYEEFDEELFEFVENQTEVSIGKIPFAQVFVSSLLQGYSNAFLTYFLGYVTINTYRSLIHGTPAQDNIRKESRKQARKAVNALVKSPVDLLSKYVQKRGGQLKEKASRFNWVRKERTEE